MAKTEKKLTVSQIEAFLKEPAYIELKHIHEKNGPVLKIGVNLLGHKWECGRNRFLISPVSGTGQLYKNADLIFLVKDNLPLIR